MLFSTIVKPENFKFFLSKPEATEGIKHTHTSSAKQN